MVCSPTFIKYRISVYIFGSILRLHISLFWSVYLPVPHSFHYRDSVCVCARACVCVKLLQSVSNSATLWTVVFQAPLSRAFSMTRILECVAIPSSRGSPRPRDWTPVSYVYCIGRWFLYHWHHLGNPRDFVVSFNFRSASPQL